MVRSATRRGPALRAAAADALRALGDRIDDLATDVPELPVLAETTTRRVTLVELADTKRIHVWRGTHSNKQPQPAQEPPGKSRPTVPLLDAAHLNALLAGNVKDAPCINPAADELLTMQGDVLVYFVRDRIRARVCQVPDLAVGKAMQVIRIKDDAMDPYYLAAGIRSTWNSAVTPGFVLSDFRPVIVPVAPVEEQRAIGRYLRDLEKTVAKADTAARAARTTLAAMSDVAGSGLLMTTPEPG